jgi:hypothetical protein
MPGRADFNGERKRPAATVAVQWAPNDTSEYTFEAFYQGYREKMFNNLHFTFADWWGDIADPANSYELYPGTNIMKSRTVGSVYGFNSGDATEASTQLSDDGLFRNLGFGVRAMTIAAPRRSAPGRPRPAFSAPT